MPEHHPASASNDPVPSLSETQADATLTGVPEALSDAAPGSQAVTPTPVPDGTPATPTSEPSREERIRRAAYDHYQRRNGEPGDAFTDWLAAEAEAADDGR